ncbi:SseB family protein [Microbacterium rhizomatis]|uniref:SseB family protein n=1 Tax=Microbacterium rhizomatis TaxID=1631477 RepID=A0A5J5J8N3_9MICO|nr:SseB family protein [Microbacterium rhizomatis]KAA9111375.1 SseB family protein [Microbacterium rhizomatis]
MAMFSRRKKNDVVRSDAAASAPDPSAPDPSAFDRAAASVPSAPAEAESTPTPPAEQEARAAPTVGISVGTFQGIGAATILRDDHADAAPPPVRPPAPAEAPAATETVPGLRDNVLLRESVATLPENPRPVDLLNVARQVLQGNVFLRVKGDARSLLSAGRELPFAVAGQGDTQFVLAYSSGAAMQDSLRADGDTGTSAMGQSSLSVIKLVLGGPYAGLIIDPSSTPAPVILPRELLQHAVDDGDENAAIKTLLAGRRTDATAHEVVNAMMGAPLWIAANRAAVDQPMGIAESRTPDGDRFLEVFSHPLEVLALGRGDTPVAVRAAQLGAALAADEGITGLLFNPGGPWLRVVRSDLMPVIALAP